jgi:septal ring factor EnvC (AmiA/AmiB activator)
LSPEPPKVETQVVTASQVNRESGVAATAREGVKSPNDRSPREPDRWVLWPGIASILALIISIFTALAAVSFTTGARTEKLDSLQKEVEKLSVAVAELRDERHQLKAELREEREQLKTQWKTELRMGPTMLGP